MDVFGWLGENTRIRGAIVWEDASGKRRFPSWPADLQQELVDTVNTYLDGGVPPTPDIPANVIILADMDEVETAFSATDAWALYRDYVAHSLAMEIVQRFTWRLNDYSVSDLTRLLSSLYLFRLVNGVYRLDSAVGRCVPAPPHMTLSFMEGAGILVGDRHDTTARLVEWCRDNLEHSYATHRVWTLEAVWQYRGYPPVTRMIAGTVDSQRPELGKKHWTAGCSGTSAFMSSVLRAINVPCTPVMRQGHIMPHFTASRTYLSHGDDPYDRITKAMPEINGHNLMVTAQDFAARFGPGATVGDVGYRVWQLGLGEVWRGTWKKGWSSFVPLREMGDTAHYLAYKIGNGTVHIDRIRPAGQGVDTLWKDGWSPGWSSFVPFRALGAQHCLAYKAGDGTVHIDRVRPDGQGVDHVWDAVWSKGWTSFVPFEIDGVPHYLAYKVATGDWAVDRIRPDAMGVDTLWGGTWTRGWTGFAVLPPASPELNPNQMLLSVKATVPINQLYAQLLSVLPGVSGPVSQLALDEIRPDATIHPLWTGTGQPWWTSVMAVNSSVISNDAVLYNVYSGALQVVDRGWDDDPKTGELKPELLNQYRDRWTGGWTTIVALDAYGRSWYLTYKRGKGTVTINHRCG